MKFFIRIFIAALLLICNAIPASAQIQVSDTVSAQDTAKVVFTPNLTPEVTVTRISKDKINIDGKLDEAEWKTAGTAENFTEIAPGDNVKPEVNTKAYVMYDDDFIYFGFECYDDMKNIRTSMTDRDNMYQDDWVGPFIDTYGNLKEAFEFYVNPYGIQGDLHWTPNNESSSRDFIYSAETKIYADKWVAEMKIPFKTLRFPDKKVQEWRVHLVRNRPRNLRQRIYWASVSRDDPNFVGQSGKFKGMENIKGGNNLELLPYVSGSESAMLKDPVTLDSELEYQNPKADFGFDIKYGLTSDLSLNGTYNPDFSQVEADAPQIDVNNPFALFYQEKRPFFLDGESSFRSQLNYVYTRSINNPVFAAKLTGSAGKKLDIGFMSAYDENTPFVIPLEDRSYVLQSNKSSFVNILRLKYDLGGENYIGGLFTDREYSSDSGFTTKFTGYNRTVGADFSFNFSRNYYINGQVTGITEREISDTAFFDRGDNFGKDKKNNAAFNGESFSGLSAYLSFERESENYGFYSEYIFESPNSRRGAGYLSRNNYHLGYTYQYYNFYPETRLLRRITPDADIDIRFNTDGINKRQYVQTGITFEFQNGTRVWGNYKWVNNENYLNTRLKDVTGWNINAENFALKQIGGGFSYSRSRDVIRFESIPSVGEGQSFSIWSNVKPIDRIVSVFRYDYSELGRSYGGELLYAGWVFTNTTSYQFNRNLFIRFVTQYDSFNDSFGCDPLISYKWNPFTALYLGTNHRFEQIENSQISNQTTLKESQRQIFIKFQYLWQM
ncbi:MAG: carbohydrate binding family 9 domain-containing protein [Ignavibacteria bacterium]|nr:carbohydrate binding family 9 domain-containing protein [Ignavibacteria bacterium]